MLSILSLFGKSLTFTQCTSYFSMSSDKKNGVLHFWHLKKEDNLCPQLKFKNERAMICNNLLNILHVMT